MSGQMNPPQWARDQTVVSHRSPERRNPIGISVVQLVAVDESFLHAQALPRHDHEGKRVRNTISPGVGE